nr:IS3 family transposase [Pseudorhodobacter ferrugineus]
MSGAKFTDEFKRDAVAQVEDRGYPVRDVAERLGVRWLTGALRMQSPRSSTKSIYSWQKLFSRPAKVIKEVDAQADEIRRLKRDLVRFTEERDILKKATAYFARESPLSRM